MEAVYVMKLTDLGIVFQIFFICLITVLHIRSNTLYAVKFNEIMYDNVMDGIVEDSLREGYRTVDMSGHPVVELDTVKEVFKAEVCLYDAEASYILMYVDYDGFYIWNSNIADAWNEKVEFTDAENTPHEQKISEITHFFKEKYAIKLNIPYNSGESFMNTIDDYSLIAISFNYNSGVESFSGAKLHKR